MRGIAILPAVGAAFACALALAGLLRPPRRLVQWSFAVGMIVLAWEAAVVALTLNAIPVSEFVFWQRLSFLTIAVLPAPWLMFSLIFARGDHPVISRKVAAMLVCACVLPVAVALAAWDQLVFAASEEAPLEGMGLRLGWAGKTLQVWLLVGSVAILTNLERTFRASVGTIRWKIKFMLIGLGVLFVVRVYSSSQFLLYREISYSFLSSLLFLRAITLPI